MERLTTKLDDGFYVADKAHNTDEVTHKLGRLEDLEEKLGFELTELEPKESASIDCSSYNENGIWKHKIFICGDDYYGSYTEDEYKEQVLKDIICGSLYALNELKKHRED
jgi:hypothetical protein